MNKELIIDTDACYRMAEQKAARYFQSLCIQVERKSYISTITKDITSWKYNHIHYRSLLSFFSRRKRKPASKGYHHYIQWLYYTGKLDHYLERSVSYIFLRDLGKALDSPDTQNSIKRVVDRLKNYLTQSIVTDHKNILRTFSMAGIYRESQKEGIEATVIWLMNRLKTVFSNIPMGMNAEEAQRKLIKIIAGVIMHAVEKMDEGITSEERMQKLDEAIRLGYSYGLTYPFIDDLLDASILTEQEKRQYSEWIRTTITTGTVPELGKWMGTNTDFIQFIHSELRNAFEYITTHLQPEARTNFFEQAYVFFNSQEMDRVKDLSNANYTNEELYLPIILKSSYSRLMVHSIISAPEDDGFDNRTFHYGIYNQLADDFADMFDDMKNDAVTPYTYYMKYHDKRADLINPFELYWTVISHLIHHVYHSDTKTCEVILDRAINGLKRFKEKIGIKKYEEVMSIFASGNPTFNRLIQNVVRKAENVDFFDKWLRDNMITILKNERKEQEDFFHTIEILTNQINSIFKISKDEEDYVMENPIIDAANYCLEGDGKRLRPIMTWVMGVEGYGLNSSAIVPLLRSLEYMHTASLIFDDLPSQDNASIRRGRSTLHQVYSFAIAELTGLFLTQKAIEEQASLDQFDSNTVLRLIQYSARVTEAMCKGQAMDLASKGKTLSLEQLNRISFYKTGIAFEASLVIPAMLAHAKQLEMEALKNFAYHAGIAFQIKDDLLDVEGELTLVGKPIGQDIENNHSTFVTILGTVGAQKAMWEHYSFAIEALQKVSCNTTFLKQLLNFIVTRDH